MYYLAKLRRTLAFCEHRSKAPILSDKFTLLLLDIFHWWAFAYDKINNEMHLSILRLVTFLTMIVYSRSVLLKTKKHGAAKFYVKLQFLFSSRNKRRWYSARILLFFTFIATWNNVRKRKRNNNFMGGWYLLFL